MSSLFHYYTQITPLENGDHTVWMDYKEKIPKFEWKHQGTGFYGKVHFPAIATLKATSKVVKLLWSKDHEVHNSDII